MTQRTYTPYGMDAVHRSSDRRLFNVVSMFAGGGGSSAGYGLAGGRVLLVNENKPEAVRTYRANFPDTIVDSRDFREVADSAASAEAFLAQSNLKPGELEVIDGSAPCQPYSPLGPGVTTGDRRRRGQNGGEQRGDASLLFEYCEFVKHVRPKVVIGENVPALMTRHRGLFRNALDTLRLSGSERDRAYFVNAAVLSASDFGVPQTRPRVFFIGVRRDVAEAIGIDCDEAVLRLFPEPTHQPITVRSAVAGLRLTREELAPWHRAMLTTSLGAVVRCLPRAPAIVTSPRMVGMGTSQWFSVYRCSWDLPAGTLTSIGQLPNGIGGLIHPEYDRKFTVRELKRLFGLPDDFLLTGNLNQAVERLGNMVAPFVTKALAEAIYERVLRPYAGNRR